MKGLYDFSEPKLGPSTDFEPDPFGDIPMSVEINQQYRLLMIYLTAADLPIPDRRLHEKGYLTLNWEQRDFELSVDMHCDHLYVITLTRKIQTGHIMVLHNSITINEIDHFFSLITWLLSADILISLI